MKIRTCWFLSILFVLSAVSFVSAQEEIKVMSYNIHHCNPPSKANLIDVDTIADVIKKQNPDIVALQEVDVNTGRSGNINQAVQLALKTGLKSFYFAKAIDYDGGYYGVAILSKFPLSDLVTYPLPSLAATKGEPRVLAVATVALANNKKIKMAVTHLDAQKAETNRLLQINAIDSIVAKETMPVIIAGDFNAEPQSEVIKLLDKQFERACVDCPPTIPEVNPKKAIDFIAHKSNKVLQVQQFKVVNESYASDHRPVYAVFKWSSKK